MALRTTRTFRRTILRLHKGSIHALTYIRQGFDVSPARLLISDLTLFQLVFSFVRLTRRERSAQPLVSRFHAQRFTSPGCARSLC